MRQTYSLISTLLIALLATVVVHGAENRGLLPVQLPDEHGRQVKIYAESHALVIGVSDYSTGWPDLPGVRTDIGKVKVALEQQGFTVKTVIDPNSQRLKAAFDGFVGSHGREPDNRLLFYFAGHGYTHMLAYGDSMGYIVPTDAANPNEDLNGFLDRAIDMQMIEVYARRIQARHALFVFDCCFSGSIFALSRAVPEIISYKTRQPVRQFITSGSADEKVPDRSIFNQQFVAALSGEGDRNGDSYVTGSELGEFLQEKVVNYSRGAQHPQYGKIRNPNLDKGDFVFRVAGSGAEPPPRVALPAPPPEEGGFSLEDIERRAAEQEAVKKAWTENLSSMQEAFSKVQTLDERDILAADKADAWSRWLEAYVRNNPFSCEDDSLRRKARERADYWRNFQPPQAQDQAAMIASIRQKLARMKPEDRMRLGAGSMVDSIETMGTTGLQYARNNQAMGRLGYTPAQIDSTNLGLERPSDRKLSAGELADQRLVEGGNATQAQEPVIKQVYAPNKTEKVDGVPGLQMISIPGGSYMMGTICTDNTWLEHSRPVHQVTLSAFQMSATEVTQAQYKAVMGKNPSGFKGDDLPVEKVSWGDAIEFCRKLSAKTGERYRLPTESEWEYACRAGTSTKYSAGDSESTLGRAGWYGKNSDKETHPVGQKQPNAWGLYDMHGNVSEWCSDWCGGYGSENATNPQGLATGSYRILRGGGWNDNVGYCRSAGRDYDYPSSRYSHVGFRVVRR